MIKNMTSLWGLIPALLCLVYFAVILLYGGMTTSFAWFWLILGAAFILSGNHRVGKVVLPLTVMLLLVLVVSVTYIVSGMQAAPAGAADYILVEGCQVKGSVPSRSLRRRLDKALECADRYPEAKLILSGGKGPGEDITEADCMFAYLQGRGISEERMVKEDRSTSTYENLVLSDQLTGCREKRVVLVSSDFHLRRSLYLAGKVGYTHPFAAGASSDPVLEVHFIVREAAAMCYYRLRDMVVGL